MWQARGERGCETVHSFQLVTDKLLPNNLSDTTKKTKLKHNFQYGLNILFTMM